MLAKNPCHCCGTKGGGGEACDNCQTRHVAVACVCSGHCGFNLPESARANVRRQSTADMQNTTAVQASGNRSHPGKFPAGKWLHVQSPSIYFVVPQASMMSNFTSKSHQRCADKAQVLHSTTPITRKHHALHDLAQPCGMACGMACSAMGCHKAATMQLLRHALSTHTKTCKTCAAK